MVTLDQVTAAHEVVFKGLMPILRALALDTLHLAMTYESCQWKKSSPGSKVLRQMLKKFEAVDHQLTLGDLERLGPYFVSGVVLKESDSDLALRSLILNGTMVEEVGKAIVETLDPSVPFLNRTEFIVAIGVVVALFPNEVSKPHSSGRSLQHCLYTATRPDKIEWMLNMTRYKHRCTTSELALLPEGTTSKEAVHSQLKFLVPKPQIHVPVYVVRKVAIIPLGQNDCTAA